VGYLSDVVNPLALATLPLTLAHQLEGFVSQLGQVASRALGLLDTAEPVAERIEALTGRAEAAVTDVERLTGVVEGISTRALALTSEVDSLVARVAGITGQADGLLDDVVALVPALASLPPVIERLAEQVDHLDKTVGEVSSMLQGVPGAARLVKRGAGLSGR